MTATTEEQTTDPSGQEPGKARGLLDEPIEGFRTRLLELAFEAATKLPVNPHMKTRSRAQEAVVTACLELGQAKHALAYIERIENWRNGCGHADLAYFCATRGVTPEAKHNLKLATAVADGLLRAGEAPQAWRRDRIRMKISRALLALGHNREAAQFQADVAVSEAALAEDVNVERMSPGDFDDRLVELQKVVARGDFDRTRNALATCQRLFDRFYSEPTRRSQVEAVVESSWSRMPPRVKIETIMELAGIALRHDDPVKALELVTEARHVLDESRWPLDSLVPLTARLAVLRYRAGEPKAACHELDGALSAFNAGLEQVANIYRAGVLRPVAEAYNAIGDRDAALAVYRKTVDEGVENPNSRPRATDLSATCCSLARNGLEPPEDLWNRLYQIYGELGDPW